MRTATWGRLGVAAATAGVVGVAGVVLAATSSAPASAADGLHRFDDCGELSDWYAQAALERVTAWGVGGEPVMPQVAGSSVTGITAEAAESANEGAGSARLTDAVGNDGTGTNVQEAGVGEPDLAKTDGRHVVVVRDDTLRVFDASGDEPRRLGEITVPGAAFDELLLVGEYAVLLGRGAVSAATPPELPDAPRPDLPTVRAPVAVVTTVDLSTPGSPHVLGTDEIDGSVISAREYDGVVRVVLASRPDLPVVVPDPDVSESEARARNRAAVRDATAEDWLPSINGRPLLDCSAVRRPEKPSGLGTLSVLTYSPGNPSSRSAVGVAADGDLVYSSADRLYVATTRGGWVMPLAEDGARLAEEGPETQLHSFVLDGEQTTYAASGSVRGRVHGRWAFSEHDGRLRVATIVGGPGQAIENAVSVLEQRGDRLRVVGSVDGLGVTEQIRAVRWFGDLAVVVTFRQTDPLYTVDLSDPEDPTVRGELKIPGYSAYLHPVGDDHLLGVGQDATLDGQETGVQIATYDLADLDDPRQVQTERLGLHTYTPVQEDSRAFTYLPERRLALIPVLGSEHDLYVVRLGAEGELTKVTHLALPGLHEGQVRALPLDDGRVALASGGTLWRIVAV